MSTENLDQQPEPAKKTPDLTAIRSHATEALEGIHGAQCSLMCMTVPEDSKATAFDVAQDLTTAEEYVSYVLKEVGGEKEEAFDAAKPVPPFEEWAIARDHARRVLREDFVLVQEACATIDAAILEMLQDSDDDENEGVNWTRAALAKIANAASGIRGVAKVLDAGHPEVFELAASEQNPSDSDLTQDARQTAVEEPDDTDPHPRDLDAEATALRPSGSYLYDGTDCIAETATIGDLVKGLFEAPNRNHSRDEDSFIRDVLLCMADEAEIMGAVSDVDQEMLARLSLRNEWRMRIVYELDRRFQAAKARVSE